MNIDTMNFKLELEFSGINFNKIVKKFQDNNIRYTENYNNNPVDMKSFKEWFLHYDCSCDIEDQVYFPGIEISSKNLTFQKIPEIKKVLNILSKIIKEDPYHNEILNNKCGLHVHIEKPKWNNNDMRWVNLILVFQQFENVLFSVHDYSRKINSYCRGFNTIDNWNSFIAKHINCRENYRDGPEMSEYPVVRNKSLTIEFRHGSMTLIPEHILNWTRLLMILISHVDKHEELMPTNYKGGTLEKLEAILRDNNASYLLNWINKRSSEEKDYKKELYLPKESNNDLSESNNETNSMAYAATA